MIASELYLQGWVTLVGVLILGGIWTVRWWHDRVAPRLTYWRHRRRADRRWDDAMRALKAGAITPNEARERAMRR